MVDKFANAASVAWVDATIPKALDNVLRPDIDPKKLDAASAELRQALKRYRMFSVFDKRRVTHGESAKFLKDTISKAEYLRDHQPRGDALAAFQEIMLAGENNPFKFLQELQKDLDRYIDVLRTCRARELSRIREKKGKHAGALRLKELANTLAYIFKKYKRANKVGRNDIRDKFISDALKALDIKVPADVRKLLSDDWQK